jgi:hypothetical protein
MNALTASLWSVRFYKAAAAEALPSAQRWCVMLDDRRQVASEAN